MGRVIAFVFVMVYDLILRGCPAFTRPSLGGACLITTLSHYVIALRKYMCVNLRGFKKTGRTLPLKALLAYQTCQK